MTSFRFLSILARRRFGSRAGLLAFTVALALGLGFGALLGRSGDRMARTWSTNKIEAGLKVADDLDRGLDDRRKALRLLARMPSMVGAEALRTQAFKAFREIYPEFEYLGLEQRPSSGKPRVRRGPRPLRLSTPIPSGGRLHAVLKGNWPGNVLASKGGFGAQVDGTITLLAGPRGSRTRTPVEPPSWERLQPLEDGRKVMLTWEDGRRYLTSVQELKNSLRSDLDLAVVCGVPEEAISARAAGARRMGLGFGAVLGLVAGVVAWVGVARSTRRLRLRNAKLLGRVEQRNAELEAAERSFRGMFENVPLGLYQCDSAGRILRANPTLAQTLGFSSPEALIEGLGSLQALGDFDVRARFLERLRTEGEVRGTTTLVQAADGRRVWLEESARVVRDGNGEITLIEGAMHDVTAQRDLEDRLRRISATDPLTGLLNRRGLDDAIAAAEAPVSFVALDVDRFKAYNDTYGHPAGDLALQAVAQAIRQAVREGDAVARAGGEEFVVVLSRTDAEGARRVAENLREAIAACRDLEMKLTASGGVATAASLNTVAEAAAAADRALYMAKEAGRNRIVVNAAKLA